MHVCTCVHMLCVVCCTDQRLDLTRGTSHDDIIVRGHLIISLASNDKSESVVTMLTGNTCDPLPEG